MRLLLRCSLLLLLSGCSHNPKLIRTERNGPVISEVWRKPDNTCEKRTYLDSMYFKIETPCEI